MYLMFDVVATKDISPGEEVLLYYGKDWENSWSWNEHIEDRLQLQLKMNKMTYIVERSITDTLGVRLNQRSRLLHDTMESKHERDA